MTPLAELRFPCATPAEIVSSLRADADRWDEQMQAGSPWWFSQEERRVIAERIALMRAAADYIDGIRII